MRRSAAEPLMMRLEDLQHRLSPVPEGRCLVGLSGGADSVALLVMLTMNASAVQPEAVHVNHGLRGTESDSDEAFVRELCKTYRVPLHVYHPDLQGHRDENTARDARYCCFRECINSTGTDTLVLAHHADDLAETFMMRLMRGAGPEGLGCMKPEDDRLGFRVIRPMLDIGRNEIREALREAGILWREDSSNDSAAYLRNDVRKRLMPLLEEMSTGAARRIAETARRIGTENEKLSEEAVRFLKMHAGRRWLDSRLLAEEHPAMQRRILRQWWRDNAPPLAEHELNARQTECLTLLALAGSGKTNLPGGMFAVKGRQALHLTGFSREILPEVSYLPEKTDFGSFSLCTGPGKGNPGDGKREQEVPAGWPDGCVVRTRRPGDRIRPFGMSGYRKLQDYLTDRGIDAPWRDEIPLLCRGSEVLLAGGVGAGNVPEWKVQQKHIRLIWHGEMPWER